MSTGPITTGSPVNFNASTGDSSNITKILKDNVASTDKSSAVFSPTVKTDVSKNQVVNNSSGQGSQISVSPEVVKADAASTGSNTAENNSTISLETGNGATNQVTTTNKQVVGAANASDDAATNADAKKALENVDAELASKLGSKYTAPTNQQDRVKLVNQVANGLSGNEKTAFLKKIGVEGEKYGLNFGRPEIKNSTANLTPAQKQIQAALYTESQTGKPYSKDVASTGTDTKNQDTKKPATDTAASGKTNTGGTALPDSELRQGAKNIVAKVKSLGSDRAAVREFFAAQDTNNDGKLSEMELITAGGGGEDGVDAVRWNTTNQRALMPEKGVAVSIDQVTDRAITESNKY
jgi:hypothetical protein